MEIDHETAPAPAKKRAKSMAKKPKPSTPEEAFLALPFHIKKEDILTLAELAKDFSISKGMCIRLNTNYDARMFIPFSLVPSSFSDKWFKHAKSIQGDMNSLLFRVSHAPIFLRKCLQKVLEVDEFTANIFRIHEIVLSEGIAQNLSLGLTRCDYMLSTDAAGDVTGIKQVENNTIATSNSAISDNIRDVHQFILRRLGIKDNELKLPCNKAHVQVAKAITNVWAAYGNFRAFVLFVVEDITINICDQRSLEFKLYKTNKHLRVLRKTFSELRKCTRVVNRCLFVDDKEIAVVYYRCGYLPTHYEPEDWETRLLMERSLAIKCPTAAFHLAGTKHVQLHLAKPGVLEDFFPERPLVVRKIREVFAHQFSLDMGEDGDQAVRSALAEPDKYVLKPEREGGGNNIYGDGIRTVLNEIGSTDARQAYLLMEKINPPKVPNCLVLNNCTVKITDVACELGIYGVIYGTEDEVYDNFEVGHILKTKEHGLDEGGIVAGFGVVDSPYLENAS